MCHLLSTSKLSFRKQDWTLFVNLRVNCRRLLRGTTSEDASGVLLEGGWEKLQDLAHLPRTWPLARLTIPLEGLSKQIDRLLEGYCLQILATNRDPEVHNGKVLQMASHLTWILAEYLADTLAWLMRSILEHDTKILCDKDTQLLLTPKFWILPPNGNFWTVHGATGPAPPRKEHGALVWSRSFARRTKSRKERGSTMPARLIRMIEGDLSNGLVDAAWSLRSMSGSLLAGRVWWRTGFSAGCSHRMILHILRVDPPQSLSLIVPKHHRGITAATVLLLVMQWRRMTVLKYSTRSDNGLCLEIPLYLYWMLPVEFSGLNLMIKPLGQP